MRTRNPRWFRQLTLEGLILLAGLLALLLLDWKKFLLYVIVPHQFAQWGIVAINFPQHDGCDPDSEWDHSRNFVGRFLNWWTFNNGFHGIHHLRPSLHWSLARRVHDSELHPHINPALEQASLAAWCVRAFVWPGRRTDFLGNPTVLPAPVDDESWVDVVLASGNDSPHLGAETDLVYAP